MKLKINPVPCKYVIINVSGIFQRTDSLVSRMFQRIDLFDGTHLLEFLCRSRKLIEPTRTIGLC